MFSAAIGIAGCMYGSVIGLCGLIGMASPCVYQSEVKCYELQQTARSYAQNGGIMVISSVACFVAGKGRETL